MYKSNEPNLFKKNNTFEFLHYALTCKSLSWCHGEYRAEKVMDPAFKEFII